MEMSPGWLEAIKLGAWVAGWLRNGKTASCEYYGAQLSRQKPSSPQPPGVMAAEGSQLVPSGPREPLCLRLRPLARGSPHSLMGWLKGTKAKLLFSIQKKLWRTISAPELSEDQLRGLCCVCEMLQLLSMSSRCCSLEHSPGNSLHTDGCFSVCFSRDQTFDRGTILCFWWV